MPVGTSTSGPNSEPSGGFHPSVKGSEPLEKGGHQMGVHASPADRAPEFHAQTLPPGTAPKGSTFQPNPDLNNQGMHSSAADTLHGADSQDVHTGLGHPGQGMTSTEIRHDGSHGGKKQGQGLVGLTTVGNDTKDTNKGRDPAFANQRALDKDYPTGVRGDTGGPMAQDQIPETADTVAAEAPRK
ncbi:hypothetical protein GQ43DRAFT_438782 [Delitschia confertaspora ATCC 74209]|uniref:Uncharacterized protein n=1 Tax=Delitschia confertaspora ATCC 74209 TaxID=1513339 RepID=A0A9P4JQR6_9PLEO|nr:hypothetical protein GQ43DRAFT_438782 [Delitschia confertaspora ATCC 74209]